MVRVTNIDDDNLIAFTQNSKLLFFQRFAANSFANNTFAVTLDKVGEIAIFYAGGGMFGRQKLHCNSMEFDAVYV